jgi:RHS repeat-associated protein
MTGVVLPNLTTWRFDYNNYGDLVKVYLPTGGTIAYTWTHGGGCSANIYSAFVNSRTVFDGTKSSTWTYGPTMTDPLGNDLVVTGGGCLEIPTELQYYSGSQNTGTLIKTVTKTYQQLPNPYFSDLVVPPHPPFLLAGTTTTWANGQTNSVTYTYDSGLSITDTNHGGEFQNQPLQSSYGLVTSESHFDYGSNKPGNLLSTSSTNYLALSNTAYLANNLLDLPGQVSVFTGAAVAGACGTNGALSCTVYGYDESSLQSSAVIEQKVAGESNPGNQTSESRWLNTSTVSQSPCNVAVSNGYLVSKRVYYDTGEVQQSTDPCGYPTSLQYSATYFGAFPTTITNALNQSTAYGYDANTGAVTSITDANQHKTTKTYDILVRLTSVSYPDGGSTSYCYTDVGGPTCTKSGPPFSVVTTRAIIASSTPPVNEIATEVYDGVGRISQTQLNSDPSGVDYALTTYDLLGRKSQVYNPTRCSSITSNCDSETTWGYVTTNYDALSRITSVVEQDGSTVSTDYSAFPCTTVTDESLHSHTSCVDGLGRITSVVEDPGSSPHLNYSTTYTYDVLNNLTGVTQNGSSSSSARVRSFQYDSLSHLTSTSNPESGIITYAYDADGNVATRVEPEANQTGTAQTNSSYTYDALNRLLTEQHSDPVNANSSYAYDGGTLSGCTGPGAPAITSSTNLVGRRSSMCSHSSASSFSYDPMGRTLFEARNNKGSSAKTYTVEYTYNLDGSLKTLTYPSGGVVTYTVGGAERVTQVSDSANSYVGFSGSPATYAPNGSLAGMTQGHASSFAGIVTSNIYNDRLQPILLSAGVSGGSSIFSLCYDFHLGVAISSTPCSFSSYTTGDNGNVFQAINNSDATRSAVFTYDPLNRIQQANTVNTTSANCWSEVYTIDAWGNLTNRAGASGMGSCKTESLSSTASTKNQLSILTYDAAGDVTNDGNGNQPTYDAEKRIASDAGFTYSYDADGTRMEKSSSSTGTMYWLGPSGEYLTESDLTGTINEEYIYFNGERIARVDRPSGTVHYYFSDHLQSASVITDALGQNPTYDYYYPYGGIASTSGSDPNHYKFTAKERDTESGLDNFGARYYGSTFGRFLTPDWETKPTDVPYANFGNPQSLNLYSYVNNNPTTTRDPDGHCFDGCVISGPTVAVAAVVVVGTAVIVGTAAYLNTPSGQRSLNTFTSAVETDISNSVGRIKGFFAPKQSQSNPWQGKPGETVQTTRPDGTPQQVRRYGPDGYPETDVDHSPHHGQPDPHAHDIGRPADGSPPTAADRGPGRDVKPGDPQQQQQQPQQQPQSQQPSVAPKSGQVPAIPQPPPKDHNGG